MISYTLVPPKKIRMRGLSRYDQEIYLEVGGGNELK